MGNCCGPCRTTKKDSSGPKVALIGATGYVGKFVTAGFLEALNEGKLFEVRVLSTKTSDITKGFAENGAKPFVVDWSNVATVVTALNGVDVVVSTLGTHGEGTKECRLAILEALGLANVKIYFPSEFGTNHYKRVHHTHPEFESKKEHFSQAQDKGIKTIGIICSLIMENSFASWLGLDNEKEVWTIVGNGEVPVAVSAEKDIARFTLEAVLKAYADPINFPELVEIYSELKTMKQYAEAFDAVAGKPTKLVFTPIGQALNHYETTKEDFVSLLQILMGEGGMDCSDANGEGNELLNPEQSVWKLKPIQDYAEETKGRP